MCGFTGIIYNHPEDISGGNQEQNDAITHHSLTGEECFHDDYVSFSFQYADFKSSDQPLTYTDETISIVFNGTIYHDARLHRDLHKDCTALANGSDVEVIAALFSRHKENMFQYLRGMFSMLIWDKQEKKLYGARDPFGIKPLFYWQTDERTVFASEKKSITSM